MLREGNGEKLMGTVYLRHLFVFLTLALPLVPLCSHGQPLAEENGRVQALERQVRSARSSEARGAAREMREDVSDRRARLEADIASAKARLDEYQKLERDLREDATDHRERAANWRREADDPVYGEAAKQRFSRLAREKEEAAEAASSRAQQYKTIADSIEAEITEMRQRSSYLEELSARLDGVINYLAPEQPDDVLTGESQPEPTYSMELDQIIGLWRAFEDGDWRFVIVPRDDNDGGVAGHYEIEAHTENRVWKGEYIPLERDDPGRGGQQGRAVLRYQPTAEEMNRDIPEWARKAVDGQVVWRIELDESGSKFDPRLSLKWFKQRVRWQDSDAESKAWIDGDGQPTEFALEREDLIEIEQWARPMLSVSLASGDHDGVREPLQALLKHQPFRVRVAMPTRLAKELGGELPVNVRALSSGASTTLKLKRRRGDWEGVTYFALDSPVTIADVYTESDREAQFGSVDYIFGTEGSRLNLEVKSGEDVAFTYQGAEQRLPVYASWVQRSLKQYEDAYERLMTIYRDLLRSPDISGETRSAVQLKRRQLENYWALSRSDILTDMHKLRIAQLYMMEEGQPVQLGVGIPPFSPRAIVQMTQWQIDRLPRHLAPPDTDTGFFNPLVKAALEGMTGDSTLGKKSFAALAGVEWTSNGEQNLVRWVILDTNSKILRRTSKTGAINALFALYKVTATTSGGDDIWLVLTGTDHMGKKRKTWERVMAGVSFSSDSFMKMHRAGTFDAIFKTKNTVWYRPMGEGASFTSMMKYRTRGRTSLENSFKYAGELPETLSAKQFDSLKIKLSRNSSPGTDQACAPLEHLPPRALKSGEVKIPEIQQLEAQQVLAHARSTARYGSQARFLDDELVSPVAPQSGGSCQLMADTFTINKRTGQSLSQRDTQERLINIMIGESLGKDRQTFVRQVVGPLRDRWYTSLATKRLVQSFGAEIAEITPRMNKKISLRHVKGALAHDFEVKMILDFSGGRAAGRMHAVSIQQVVEDANGAITHVRFFDPAYGRRMELPSEIFDRLIARKGLNYSAMTISRWGGAGF